MTFVENEATDIYTVSRFNDEVRFLLEDTYPHVWIEGEISNFAAPHSGHWYFSLKDSQAQIKCAMFKGSQKKTLFTPKDGMHVLIRARASLYPARGDFQLIADVMEERGEGKLRREFEALRKKLEAAGLFNIEHKNPLPTFPGQIGVITSATGAAIRDILHVLKRRHPCVTVIIYPALVQGKTAAPSIVKAIQIANKRQECDVLILARGGGSLEDLWPFNEEIVAHAIFESKIPIISGVGHEIDFTIADFVADVRAPTPSAAAEIAVPDKNELVKLLTKEQQQITRCMLHKLSVSKQQITWADKHLFQLHPKRQLTEKMQRLDMCEMKLDKLIISQLNKLKSSLTHCAAKLDALSPLATLKRGFAIATNDKQQVIHSAKEVKPGANIAVKLYEGSLDCTVDKTR